MTIASISSEICASNEYYSSMIGLSQDYMGVAGDIDCDLIYGGAISNLGEVDKDEDYAIAHISCIGVDMNLISIIGNGSPSYELGEVG